MGGWISVIYWSLTVLFFFWGFDAGNLALLEGIFFLLAAYQLVGSIAVVRHRWTGAIGIVASIINDSNGCIPHGGFGYYNRGHRSQVFRIIQTTELTYSIIVWFVLGFILKTSKNGIYKITWTISLYIPRIA